MLGSERGDRSFQTLLQTGVKHESSPPKSEALHSQGGTLLCSLLLVRTDLVQTPLTTAPIRVQERTQLGKKAKPTPATPTSQPSPPV